MKFNLYDALEDLGYDRELAKRTLIGMAWGAPWKPFDLLIWTDAMRLIDENPTLIPTYETMRRKADAH